MPFYNNTFYPKQYVHQRYKRLRYQPSAESPIRVPSCGSLKNGPLLQLKAKPLPGDSRDSHTAERPFLYQESLGKWLHGERKAAISLSVFSTKSRKNPTTAKALLLRSVSWSTAAGMLMLLSVFPGNHSNFTPSRRRRRHNPIFRRKAALQSR